MPILVTLPAPPEAPEQPPPSTPAPPISTPRRWELASDTSGEVRSLTTDWPFGVRLLKGMSGVGLAPVSLASDPRPDDHGSVFRGVRLGDRDVFVPLILWGQTEPEVTALRRDVEEMLDPLEGTVTLTVAHPTGERRSVTGHYVGGAEGNHAADLWGRAFQKIGVVIRCLDPWWKAEPVTQRWQLAAATAKEFLPSTPTQFFPIELAASQVAGVAVVTNLGDTTAEPVWRITGPGSALTVTNETTGEEWALAGDIDPGQTIVVDCRRDQQTVVDAADDANLFDRLGADPQLWTLARGANTITISLTDADADSLVEVTFVPRLRSMG